MQNIQGIYISLIFFIYTILFAVAYIIIKDMMDIVNDKKVKKLDNTFRKEILRQLDIIKSGKDISKLDIKYVAERLSKENYIRSFVNTIKDFNENEENHKFTRIYISNFQDTIKKLLVKGKRKDEIIKVYYAVILGEFRFSNFEINSFLMHSLTSKSMYLRVTSFESISKIGDLKNFISAIKLISENKHYINNKVFIDILNEFDGNVYELNRWLIKDINDYSIDIKRNIIEYFRNNKVETVKDELIKLLKDENTEKEVKISLIKYFSVIIHKYAKDEIINILRGNNWEYRAVCAKALMNYKSKESIDALLESITDTNWYVRYNSAVSLLEFGDEVLDLVLLKGDRYSKDIIFYAMFMKQKITYEEYLEKSNELEVVCNV